MRPILVYRDGEITFPIDTTSILNADVILTLELEDSFIPQGILFANFGIFAEVFKQVAANDFKFPDDHRVPKLSQTAFLLQPNGELYTFDFEVSDNDRVSVDLIPMAKGKVAWVWMRGNSSVMKALNSAVTEFREIPVETIIKTYQSTELCEMNSVRYMTLSVEELLKRWNKFYKKDNVQ